MMRGRVSKRLGRSGLGELRVLDLSCQSESKLGSVRTLPRRIRSPAVRSAKSCDGGSVGAHRSAGGRPARRRFGFHFPPAVPISDSRRNTSRILAARSEVSSHNLRDAVDVWNRSTQDSEQSP